MSDCRKCAEFDWCVENEDCGLFKLKPMTNADRIRSMMDGELANFFDDIETKAYMSEYRGVLGWLEWLKSESEDANEDN